MPYPPTSNHNTMVMRGRRISSPKYRAWRLIAELQAKCQAGGRSVEGPYTIRYTVERPDRRLRDVENIPKSISDALQAAGVIRDDCNCMESTVGWATCKPSKDARVIVRITPL